MTDNSTPDPIDELRQQLAQAQPTHRRSRIEKLRHPRWHHRPRLPQAAGRGCASIGREWQPSRSFRSTRSIEAGQTLGFLKVQQQPPQSPAPFRACENPSGKGHELPGVAESTGSADPRTVAGRQDRSQPRSAQCLDLSSIAVFDTVFENSSALA